MDIQPIRNAIDIAIATEFGVYVRGHAIFRRKPPVPLDYQRRVGYVGDVEVGLRFLEGLSIGVLPDLRRWRGKPQLIASHVEKGDDENPERGWFRRRPFSVWNHTGVASFYSVWHHPKQVNFAYSALRALREHKVKGGDIFGIANGRAHFVDFGCGALAMQFAVAMAAADSISRGRELREIRIDSYDPSREMVRIGQYIWIKFVRLMKLHYPKHPICEAFDLIQWKTHAELDTLPEATDAACFLSAIHAVYETTKIRVKDDLESLVSKYAPVGFLFTADATRRNLLSDASPIAGRARYAKVSAPIPKARFAGELGALTKRMRSLCDRLLNERELPPGMGGVDREFVRNSLYKPITWQYPNPAIAFYRRKDISEFTG